MPPRTHVAQNILPNQNWRFGTDKDGNIIALMVDVEVNYGTFGRPETENLWPQLTNEQRQAIQDDFNLVTTILKALILGSTIADGE